MKKNYPYLKDSNFLNFLYGQHNKTIYSKVTTLDWDEKELQSIEGKVTSGNISCNGDSSVRRTANLSIKILNKDELYQNVDSFISINKKIFLEIGLKNNVRHLGDKYYPEYPIIWFPFGTYIIQNYSLTHDATNGVSISLSLGDKMCLLNGEAGGVIPASVNFESYDTLGPDGDLHTEYLEINRIIPEIVNHFGKESLNNIIVNDIDNKIKQVLKWKGSSPLYLWENKTNRKDIFYTTINGTNETFAERFKTRKITYNYDAGYTYVPFVYPGELTANAGDTVCTVLDKIKNTLGNYEYYYDVFGNFIFQEIKNYVNVSEWYTIEHDQLPERKKINEEYLPYAYNTRLNASVYDFKNNDFIISYSSAPQFNMIKNDFVVWGKSKNSAGVEYPCRYHLAIDKRPKLLEEWRNPLPFCFDTSVSDGIRRCFAVEKEYATLDLLKSEIPQGIVGKYYYINEEEAIYTWISDIKNYEMLLNNFLTASSNGQESGFTSDVTGQKPEAGYVKMTLATYYAKNNFIIPGPDAEGKQQTDWRNILYFQGLISSVNGLQDTNYYWAEMCNEWPKVYDIENNEWFEDTLNFPASLDWWLDFIDNDATLNQFCVDAIGRRSFSTVVSECNCVFEQDIPNAIIVNTGVGHEIDSRSQMTDEQFEELGLVPTQVSQSVYDALVPGGTFNSCYQYVRQLLTNYTDYNESVNFSCLPIYHLEPNTRITINDPDTGIHGDYIINTINFGLDQNGVMSISAKKCIEKI